ncbi:MAG: hypothetical protein L3J74_18550, partial [Bacteroidales bacterium]|nr:hypothetical protein [Bacteroidales bacterium]
ELKVRERKVVYNNVHSASYIGIIFNAEDKVFYAAAKEFMNYIDERGIKINALSFVPKSDLIGYFPYRKGVEYFGMDKLAWTGKPKEEGVEEFIERPFDILIDISLTGSFPNEYVFALSKAKFKICNNSSIEKYADFVLQLKNKEDIDNYIEQIKHYLESIETH